MSHFTTNSKCNIVDTKAFEDAVRELGFAKVTRNTMLKGYMGNTMKVDIAVACGSYGIGLIKNAEGKYDMVADWWGLRHPGMLPPQFIKALKGEGLTDAAIQDCVLRYTTKHTIVNKYKKMGFNCATTEDKAGNIQVTMTKF